MKASSLAALIVGLAVATTASAQSATDAERADADGSTGTTPLENGKPGIDGIIRAGILIDAQFVAMPAEMLERMGFKTQQQGFVHDEICRADLIVVATATKSVSAFSVSHGSIFTRVTFENLQVLRAKRNIHWREPLSVFVMSGTLSVNGQRYEFTNNRAPGYRVNTQYLLRLHRDSVDPTQFNTAGFWPERSDGSLIAETYDAAPGAYTALKADLDRILAHGACPD